ncbi:hypothetical protein LCGC14_2934150, partial [marine sediment metagenome]
IAHKEFHKMCEEKDCDCKQFTPSEEVCPTRKKGKKCNVCDSLENKGCSKCKGMGVYHSPSCFKLSDKIKFCKILGYVNETEDIKEFIRRLKRNTYWVNCHSDLCEEIDKLAGDFNG